MSHIPSRATICPYGCVAGPDLSAGSAVRDAALRHSPNARMPAEQKTPTETVPVVIAGTVVGWIDPDDRHGATISCDVTIEPDPAVTLSVGAWARPIGFEVRTRIRELRLPSVRSIIDGSTSGWEYTG